MPLPAPTKARVAKLRAKLDAAIAEVYACGPDRNTRLSDCLALAPFEIESRYHNALHDLEEAEAEAVATGRAFRVSNTYGMLIWKR